MKYEYYKTKETVKEYIKLAEGVNGSKLIDKLKAYLPVNSTLLEIGSGPVKPSRSLTVYIRTKYYNI